MPSAPVSSSGPASNSQLGEAWSELPGHSSACDELAADQWLTLDKQLCFALYSSHLAMTRLYKPLLAPLGLTYPQYISLLALWERGEQAEAWMVSELGARLGLDSGTLTPLLKRLEAQGLIRRERDAQDERRVRISLTPAAWKLRESASSIPGQLLCASGTDLSQIVSLTQTLRELQCRLDAAADSALQARSAQSDAGAAVKDENAGSS